MMRFTLKKALFGLRGRRRKGVEIAPDEVMIDASNVGNFDTSQLEGRIEKPISRLTLYIVAGSFFMIAAIFVAQAVNLQIVKGDEYLARSQKNLLRPVPIFAGRGVITDRNGSLLAWNAPSVEPKNGERESAGGDDSDKQLQLEPTEDSVPRREYATSTGLAHIIGYVQYPSKDKNGFYYQDDFEGISGSEAYFDEMLKGENGSRLVEVDAMGDIVSENIVRPPESGGSVALSIDSRVQSALYRNIREIARDVGFEGGAGTIIDVRTGEILALTSYPEYNSQVMSDRDDINRVRSMLNDPDLPFLNRAVDGLYVPGSVVKPFIALAALTEKVIDPDTIIHTTGSISIPNPYDPDKSTIFRDWKNNGSLDMRRAIAVSSDAYFYIIGGGYKDQRGLGIANIDKYLRMFGLGSLMPESFAQGKAGTIPTPEWKKATFNEEWYLGNTYHTAIGQYGFQVTLMQIVRAVAAIANGGSLLVPSVIKDAQPDIERVIESISPRSYDIVRQGMRLSVTEGTSKALNVPYVEVAGKSGTAELGVSKEKVNSWITGFWSYNEPRYAFAVMLEKGSVHNLIGAAAVMRQQLDWMSENTPEYFK